MHDYTQSYRPATVGVTLSRIDAVEIAGRGRRTPPSLERPAGYGRRDWRTRRDPALHPASFLNALYAASRCVRKIRTGQYRQGFGQRALGRLPQFSADAQHHPADIVTHDPVIRIYAATPSLRLQPSLIEDNLVDHGQLTEYYWVEYDHGGETAAIGKATL